MKLSVESDNVVFPLQKIPELIMKECLPLIKDWFFADSHLNRPA